jgi:hypothetical protein
MKLTNKSGLPDVLVKAIKNDNYTKGESDFSVTELLQPPRLRALKTRHFHEIEEDAEDKLYSLYGQLVHLLIERAAHEGEIAEKRFFAKFGNGVTVSAQVDSLSITSGVLTDWKFVTAWKFKGGRAADELWTAQLNMQLEILRQNGHDAKAIQIVGLIRDFSKPEARRNESYPQSPVVVAPIEMWEREKTQEFINERIKMHTASALSLPECSKEDRWATDDTYALMKKGQKRAVKLFTDKAEAEAAAQNLAQHFVEFREGEPKRCAMYCPVNKFCKQYQSTLKGADDDQNSGTVA